jgi:hypothetical protein
MRMLRETNCNVFHNATPTCAPLIHDLFTETAIKGSLIRTDPRRLSLSQNLQHVFSPWGLGSLFIITKGAMESSSTGR